MPRLPRHANGRIVRGDELLCYGPLVPRWSKDDDDDVKLAMGNDTPEEMRKLLAKFAAVKPSEAKRRPPPEYWDNSRLFPKIKGGSLNIIYAAFSNFKTTWSVGHALHTAKAQGCRILYIVGEGADGFGPKTIAAAQRDWNIHHPDDQMTDDWLDDHLILVEHAPLLSIAALGVLADGEVGALISVHRDSKPNLVFLDTLGSALAGEDISSTAFGTAVGRIMNEFARALRADVFLCPSSGFSGQRAG